MFFKQNKTKGFTLIELLVVVAIISLLASVVFASLNSARAKARNAARLQVINTFVNAFNLSLGDSGSLPSTINAYVCITATCYGGWAGYQTNATVDAFLAPSLPSKPVDPNDGTRGIGGFLYINSKTVFGTSGAWINYLMEPGGNCGPGRFYNSTSTYVQCYIQL